MKRKLLFVAAVVAGAVGFNAHAQKDVTEKYLVNPGFETSPIFDGTSLGADKSETATPVDGAEKAYPETNAVNVYKVAGWTNLAQPSDANDYERVFTMPYENTLYVQSDKAVGGQAIAAPANASSDASEGNKSLLIVAASWSPGVTLGIKQDVELPKGVYKLTFDSYVTTTIDNAASLCGVKVGDKTTYVWPSAKDTWTNNEILFVVEEDGVATEISMGYTKARNKGGGETPFLFVDNVKLYQVKPHMPNVESEDATESIKNPNADEDPKNSWTGATGWKNDNTLGFDGKKGFFEPGNWGAKGWSVNLSQELTGLENGLYTLKAAVQNSARVVTYLKAGTSISTVLPANGESNGTIDAEGKVVEAGEGVKGWNYGYVTALVTDGKLTIGAYSTTFDNADADEHQWTNLDNFTLSYIPMSALEDVMIETDMTNQFMDLTDPVKWSANTDAGSNAVSGHAVACAESFAPAQELNNGQKKQMVENFRNNCGSTGKIMWTEIPGLTPGEYEIELYGAAAYTGSRDTDILSEFFKNDATAENSKETDTKIYLYASATTDDQVEIPAHKATNFSAIATAKLNVTVGTDGKVTIGLKKESTATNWHVVQLKGVTAKVNGAELIDNLKEQIADMLANEDYENVTGGERTAMETAADATPEEETAEAYNDVIDAMQAAITAFTAAKADYDVFAAAVALASEYADLPYASKDKKAALDAVLEVEPASAEEAKTAAAAITKPLRQYVESNALAKGVDGAEDMTDKILNNASPENNDNWTTSTMNNPATGQPYTDGEGVEHNKYFDGGNWGGSSWTAYMEQTVELLAGKYLLSVTARGEVDLTTFKLSAAGEEVDLKHVGGLGAESVFGNGWNDANLEFQIEETGEVTIRIDAAAETQYQWFSADRFRLVRLSNVEYIMEVTDAGYATYVAPADIEFKNDAYVIFGLDDEEENAVLTPVASVKKDTPVIIAGAGKHAFVATEDADEINGTNLLKVAPEAGVDVAEGIYVLANLDKVGFYAVDADKIATLPEGIVYLQWAAASGDTDADEVKFIGFVFGDGATAIKGVETPAAQDGIYYNLAGQRVQAPTKGIYIVNGKKVLVK